MLKPKRTTKFKKYESALKKIAGMGGGLSLANIDFANIGRDAVREAKDALAKRCPKCGKEES